MGSVISEQEQESYADWPWEPEMWEEEKREPKMWEEVKIESYKQWNQPHTALVAA